MKLFKNVRFYVLLFTLLLSFVVSMLTKIHFTEPRLQTIRLTQIYALISLIYLYFVLLAGPLCFTFRSLPIRGVYLKARRALGVSAFYFGFLHACTAFFGQLGGFEGLGFLNQKFILAITLSFIALVILTAMASTSFDRVVGKMKYKNWKVLHRLVYMAVIFIFIHAFLIGTHFKDLSASIPVVFIVAFSFLLILETIRIYAFFKKKYEK